MSRVTVVDVLDACACIDGVLAWVADHEVIACDPRDFPNEPYIQSVVNGNGYGYGDGYGYGYGDGYGRALR